MKDFIIVGRGLAATCLMHSFKANNIDFTVLGNPNLSRSSLVAAGIWNPIVFKRLTKSWMADELIPNLIEFYKKAEALTGASFIKERQILRVFSESQEQDLWQKKSKNELDDYLEPKIYSEKQAPVHCNINSSFSHVLKAGNLDIKSFIAASEKTFAAEVFEENFDHTLLEVTESVVSYKNYKAKAIVFCEGWLVKNNPWFNWIPLKPAKGEVLTLKIPELNIGDEIINRNSFLFKSTESEFKCGATYQWNDLNETPTVEAKIEFEQKLRSHTSLPYSVVKHEAAVRPASIDRRPVIGPHPKFANVYVFNGLGTKGVMLAPYFSQKFVHFYLEKESLMPEVGVTRFYHLYEEKTQGQSHRKT